MWVVILNSAQSLPTFISTYKQRFLDCHSNYLLLVSWEFLSTFMGNNLYPTANIILVCSPPHVDVLCPGVPPQTPSGPPGHEVFQRTCMVLPISKRQQAAARQAGWKCVDKARRLWHQSGVNWVHTPGGEFPRGYPRIHGS